MEKETCAVCGREFNKHKLTEIFTGRVRYVCPDCLTAGNKEIDSRHAAWRQTARGKQVIAQNEKSK